MEDECDVIKASLQAANVKQAEIREESAFLKAENGRLKDNINLSSRDRDGLNAQLQSYQDQIVNSPDRFRKQISSVENALTDISGGNKNLEKKARELQAWIDSIDTAQLLVKKASQGMEDLRDEVDKQKEDIAKENGKKQEVDLKRNALSQIDLNVKHELRKVQRTREKIALIRKQGSVRSKANSENMSLLHRELIGSESTCIEFSTKAEHAEADSIMAEKGMDAARIQQEQQRQFMHASYKRLEETIINHLQRLRGTFCDGGDNDGTALEAL